MFSTHPQVTPYTQKLLARAPRLPDLLCLQLHFAKHKLPRVVHATNQSTAFMKPWTQISSPMCPRRVWQPQDDTLKSGTTVLLAMRHFYQRQCNVIGGLPARARPDLLRSR